MPVSESGHQQQPAWPQGLGATQSCWVVRFTGEVFTDYE
jgi:hypothetical protein